MFSPGLQALGIGGSAQPSAPFEVCVSLIAGMHPVLPSSLLEQMCPRKARASASNTRSVLEIKGRNALRHILLKSISSCLVFPNLLCCPRPRFRKEEQCSAKVPATETRTERHNELTPPVQG